MWSNDSDQSDRRGHHNFSEKKRRSTLGHWFDQLRKSLPSPLHAKMAKSSRTEIMRKAAKIINSKERLKRTLDDINTENHYLKMAYGKLEAASKSKDSTVFEKIIADPKLLHYLNENPVPVKKIKLEDQEIYGTDDEETSEASSNEDDMESGESKDLNSEDSNVENFDYWNEVTGITIKKEVDSS